MAASAAASASAAAAAPAEAEPQGPGVPPGLSRADVAWVEGKSPPAVDSLSKRKLGTLNFLVTCDVPPKVRRHSWCSRGRTRSHCFPFCWRHQ